MDDEQMTLRDRFAMEVLNGILSNEKTGDTSDGFRAILHYLFHKDEHLRNGYRTIAEELVRSCYAMADIIRKVRLSTFE